jgi:hypothetical protein
MKFEIFDYHITAIMEGGEYFHEQSVSFIAEKDGVKFPLKTKFDNEFIRDLYCITSLDPRQALANIAIEEIKNELEKRNKS